jgi:hypothetical protein
MPRRTARREALVLTQDGGWAFFVFCRHRSARPSRPKDLRAFMCE